MGLTVAVTGPTGEIGIPAVDALEASPEVERVVGMARRSFDPASYGWVKTEYRRGDILVPDNPQPLTEAVPTRGSDEHYYSQQKAECEELLTQATAGADLGVYVLRPCIVAGPQATALADAMPWRQVADRLPAMVRTALARVPGIRTVVPDPGNELQLVHHDDVATAIAAAALGRGEPGAYNLAAEGTVTFGDVASCLGARPVPVPRTAAVLASNVVARLPWVPATAEWIHVARTPVLMDTTRAKALLGWTPQHTSAETLASMAETLRLR